jgi:hypothetical protein
MNIKYLNKFYYVYKTLKFFKLKQKNNQVKKNTPNMRFFKNFSKTLSKPKNKSINKKKPKANCLINYLKVN